MTIKSDRSCSNNQKFLYIREEIFLANETLMI